MRRRHPRGLVADLGGMPEQCALFLEEAAANLRRALEIVRRIQDASKRGRQMGEALSAVGIIAALPERASYAAQRVRQIPNAPQKLNPKEIQP